jgi:hypothetical protein
MEVAAREVFPRGEMTHKCRTREHDFTVSGDSRKQFASSARILYI